MKIIELDTIKIFEDISRDEIIKSLRSKQEKKYLKMILKKMHQLVQKHGDRQSLSGYAFEISRYLGGAISPRELERMYRKEYMNESQMSTRKKIVENTNIIDNKKGWGAVPNNQEVDYLGLRVKMSPRTFINLAAPLDREPSEDIIKHIQNGGTIGSPFLIIEIPESWREGDLSMPARVVGHEGRNRMLAIAKAIGNNPIEVHLFFSQGLRNRHITDDFKKVLNKGLVKEKSKSIVKGPLFSLTESMLEWGRIVKGVNTTVDVGPNEIKRQAAKFGNTVDKDGRPPTMSKRVKGSSTNVLYNLGLAENYTTLQLAIMEGGHSLEKDEPKEKKKTGILFDSLVELEENFSESKVNYSTPNFDHEWEEAERYPEFKKIGKEDWIELVKKGKAITIKSAKGINNTDAADPNSFKSLDPTKQKRALAQLKKGTVEMPIVAVYSDGYKELVGGNTRLTAMMARDGIATVWAFKVPDEVADLAENLTKKTVNNSTNALYNLGLTEIEIAFLEGGHSLADKDRKPIKKQPGDIYKTLIESEARILESIPPGNDQSYSQYTIDDYLQDYEEILQANKSGVELYAEEGRELTADIIRSWNPENAAKYPELIDDTLRYYHYLINSQTGI